MIDRVYVSAYDSLTKVCNLHEDEINKHIKKHISFTQIIQDLYRLVMPDLQAPYNYRRDDAHKISPPDTKILMVGITGPGTKALLGIHAPSTIVMAEDMLFKRITWNEMGITGKVSGFSEQRNSKLIWYLRILNTPPETFKKVSAFFGEKL